MRTWAYERKFVMPTKRLPSNPNLDHLRYQAKDLLRGHAARDLSVAQRIREFHPRFSRASDGEIFDAKISLSGAQLAIAREYGFPSWARLKAHVEAPTLSNQLNLPHHERIKDAVFRRAVDLLDAGDHAGLRDYIREHPKLMRLRAVFEGGNYFRNPTLLEFAAENPVRHGKLPDNIADVVTVILDAGAEPSALDETLMLIATGRVPRECHVQVSLIDLLCDRGADPGSALRAAVSHGEFEAVDALIRRGARIDLPVAAALGRLDDFRGLLPAARSEDRHLALALASQLGRVEVVRMLLDDGEDPNRYNPVGSHSHSTPLHQAALGGHADIVRLLVERGARVDLKDVIWQGTPADWARHAGNTELEAFLREHEAGRERQA
jgi:Ankyrin repeats (3 copies)